jgi:uncharacterized protein (DUF1697 family)
MKHVALLRGINVGGRTIPMAELRACFSDMGLDEAETVLQTGNVIFSSDDAPANLKRSIEAGLRERFRYPAHVHVLTMPQLRQIIETSPFDGSGPEMHSYVVFFEGGLEVELMAEVRDVENVVEVIELGDGVLYWRVPKGSTLKSGFAKYLTKARYRDAHTSRNINTLHKIVS